MNFSLTTIILLAAAGGCRGYDYDYDVSVQTQEVPWEETPSPSPVDVDTDSLEPTPSPSSSSTALSTFVQSMYHRRYGRGEEASWCPSKDSEDY